MIDDWLLPHAEDSVGRCTATRVPLPYPRPRILSSRPHATRSLGVSHAHERRRVPKLGYGTNFFMPIFRPNPRTNLLFFCRVEKVMPFRFTCAMPIPLTYIRVLIAADDALKSAAEAGGRTSEVDKKFEQAIDMLSSFEKGFPPNNPTSGPNIGGIVTREAKMSDKSMSPSTILYALKNNLHANVMFLSMSLLLNIDEP